MPSSEVTPHPRAIIRAALVALIKGEVPGEGEGPSTFATDAGRNVVDSRDLPLNERAMPAVLVYTRGETLDREHLHDDGVRRRTMETAVEVYDLGDDAAERVDRIAWQVENAVRSDPTLGGLVERVDYVEARIEYVTNAQNALFVALMTLEVVYWTHAREPEEGRPLEVMLGFAPPVGPGNEAEYVRIDDLPLSGDIL